MMAYAGRHYLAILFDVNTPDGERIGHGGLIRDVTHEHEIEQMKDSLISVAAHEFKTPVTALRMRVESLLREDAHWSEEFRQELLSGMRDDVGALQTLISDWLDIARIESGSLRLSIEEVAIEEVIQSAVDAARIYGVFDLTLQIGPELTAPVDEQRLRQVLINLLSNAIRYCDRTPDIVIEATRNTKDELTISVRDNGIGIAATDLEQVFERYYQVQRGNVRRAGGTGLGLAITRRLAELMGGAAGVESQLGVGSTFWFTARLYYGAEDFPSRSRGMDQAEIRLRERHAGKRVLLVDDEPINLEVTHFFLDSVGLAVEKAENGMEALCKASAEKFALVLMDMQMPVLDGLEATRQIRSLPGWKYVPILAMTANAFAEDKLRCVDAGMNDHIIKPYEPELFFSTILRWLDRGTAV